MHEFLWESESLCPLYQSENNQPIPDVDLYLHEDETIRPAIVIFPGGGYAMRAPHEGEGYAKYFHDKGYQCFVVSYRVAPYAHPAMLTDGLRAVRYVRYHAERFHVDPKKIAVMGSSAGGHLAVTCMTHFADALPKADAIDEMSARPDAAILCYPVVTLEDYTHTGTRDNFCAGHENKEELCHAYSGEIAVSADCPPVFLWHADNDPAVPVENSLQLASALKKSGVRFSLHIYPDNRHGIGLAEAEPLLCHWPQEVCDWLASTLR